MSYAMERYRSFVKNTFKKMFNSPEQTIEPRLYGKNEIRKDDGVVSLLIKDAPVLKVWTDPDTGKTDISLKLSGDFGCCDRACAILEQLDIPEFKELGILGVVYSSSAPNLKIAIKECSSFCKLASLNSNRFYDVKLLCEVAERRLANAL